MFTYTIPPPEEPEDLNAFLAAKKILSTRSEIMTKGDTPYLLFIVEYLESGKPDNPRPPKVDYREILSEADFQAFSSLRDLRKTIAEREGVPVYAVFTNAQLAEMVQKPIRSKQDILSIDGVGQGKADKYGQEFLTACANVLPAGEKAEGQ